MRNQNIFTIMKYIRMDKVHHRYAIFQISKKKLENSCVLYFYKKNEKIKQKKQRYVNFSWAILCAQNICTNFLKFAYHLVGIVDIIKLESIAAEELVQQSLDFILVEQCMLFNRVAIHLIWLYTAAWNAAIHLIRRCVS